MPTAQNSIRHFHLMEQFKTHRMQDLEVLSKREVELSYPSQRVTYIDRFSAAVCCVVGSCFSLQKEYETALIDSSRGVTNTLPMRILTSQLHATETRSWPTKGITTPGSTLGQFATAKKSLTSPTITCNINPPT